MNELIALTVALGVHEFGHYIHYLLLGFRPKLRWIGVGPCVDSEIKAIPVKYVVSNIFVAISLGIIPLKYFQVSDIAFFAYFVGCFMDLNNAQLILIYIYRKTITPDTTVDRIKVVIDGKNVS